MPATIAAESYPRLLFHARCELRQLRLNPDEAEDLVQEAARRWLERVAEIQSPEAWLKTCIRGLAIAIVRRPRDPLDLDPLSLDEFPL